MAQGGGPFDPEGCRGVDVRRADDIVALVDAIPGRWVLITLTINRRLFLGPEAAYQRANEYVRKAVGGACPKGVYVSAFEVQGKTGAGWPHWHILAWVPDHRSILEIKAAVERGWRTRTAEVDPESGEVLSWSSERIGFVDVQDARSRRGISRYCAKYVTKPWRAVPRWMLESCRRFRKVRCSSAVYPILERLHRHEVHRGGRVERVGTGRRTRTLLQRMASSASSMMVFRERGEGRSSFAFTLPVPRDRVLQLVEGGQVRILQLGKWRRMRFELSPQFARRFAEDARLRARWREERRRFEADRAGWISMAWQLHQEGGDVRLHDVEAGGG